MTVAPPVTYFEVSSDLGRTVRVYPDAMCVCGSARRLRACCMSGGAMSLNSAPSPTRPPGPPTGYAHRRCYARALNDCDEKVSKEHYFSRGVMKAVASGVTPKTVRLVRDGRPDQELPPDQAAQAKILCRRHNSALSPLDVVGERLFGALREGLLLIPRYSYRSLPGVDVERWLVKVACGNRAAEKEEVPVSWLRVLFGYDELSAPLGLYMHMPPERTVHASAGLQFGSYHRDEVPTGAEVTLDGVRFTLDLVGDLRTHREEDVGALKIFRPSGLWFDHADLTTFHLGFEWGDRPSATNSLVLHVQ